MCLFLATAWGQNVPKNESKRFSVYTDSMLFKPDFKIKQDFKHPNKTKPLRSDIDFNYLSSSYSIKSNTQQIQKALTIPGALAFIGLYSGHKNNTRSWIGKHTIQARVRKEFPAFRSHLDDYLQWGPIAMTYSVKACGIRGRNNIWTSTKLLLKAELLTGLFCHTFKNLASNTRPNGHNTKSFPSGHTSQAFVAATFMHKELGHLNTWYSVAAYGMASTVGTMRMMNNMHWFSDVMVGAAAGIGITNLVYLLHDKSQKRKERKWVAVPTINSDTIGLAMNIKL